MAPGVEGYSTVRINDGKFHQVEVVVDKENATLQVDGVFQSRLMTQYKKDQRVMKLLEPVYVGGGPLNVLDAARRNWYLRHAFGFSGEGSASELSM